MSQGETNCPFLMLTGASAQRRCNHKISLPAQKRGNLQHVDDFRDSCNVRDLVNVGQHRNLNLIFYFLQNPQTFLQSGPAKTANRCAIGLVVAGLEDEGESERLRHALNDFGHANGVLFAFDHAWAGNEKETARPDTDIADLKGSGQQSHLESFHHIDTEAQRNPRYWSCLLCVYVTLR